LGVLVVVTWLMPRTQGPVLRPGQLEPITALSGDVRAPALSADATRMVFAWNGAGMLDGRAARLVARWPAIGVCVHHRRR
jgi:hypothetical protein